MWADGSSSCPACGELRCRRCELRSFGRDVLVGLVVVTFAGIVYGFTTAALRRVP